MTLQITEITGKEIEERDINLVRLVIQFITLMVQDDETPDSFYEWLKSPMVVGFNEVLDLKDFRKTADGLLAENKVHLIMGDSENPEKIMAYYDE